MDLVVVVQHGVSAVVRALFIIRPIVDGQGSYNVFGREHMSGKI